MFNRKASQEIRDHLGWSPAVAILGARQIGKTTLARQIAVEFPKSVYLDLENSQARAKLEQADVFFQANRDRLIVLDEIQNAPELFSTMRGEIDADRRNGRFLILGSASFKLLQQLLERELYLQPELLKHLQIVTVFLMLQIGLLQLN